VMGELKTWMEQQLEDRLVEPNSRLGGAFDYLLKRWEALTRFLHIPGAPLDNNTAERALKIILRYRNNSLFYKNEHGAYVGDVLTGLIETCRLNGSNPLDYLRALMENRSAVFADPAAWLPWNYRDAPHIFISRGGSRSDHMHRSHHLDRPRLLRAPHPSLPAVSAGSRSWVHRLSAVSLPGNGRHHGGRQRPGVCAAGHRPSSQYWTERRAKTLRRFHHQLCARCRHRGVAEPGVALSIGGVLRIFRRRVHRLSRYVPTPSLSRG